MHCFDTWDWKQIHRIRYSPSAGMFPLCAECFEELGVGAICAYIDLLVDKWEKDPDPDRDYDAVRKSAKEEVFWQKCGDRPNLDPRYTAKGF